MAVLSRSRRPGRSSELDRRLRLKDGTVNKAESSCLRVHTLPSALRGPFVHNYSILQPVQGEETKGAVPERPPSR